MQNAKTIGFLKMSFKSQNLKNAQNPYKQRVKLNFVFQRRNTSVLNKINTVDFLPFLIDLIKWLYKFQ